MMIMPDRQVGLVHGKYAMHENSMEDLSGLNSQGYNGGY